nr:MAG TPA: Helix-turn-helix protein [Caudoviricetes sp.]
MTFLNRTGTTVKNWRSGKTLPDVLTLYELHALTGIAIESMCVDDAA